MAAYVADAVKHLAIDTDGTPASLRTALDSVKNNPACIAIHAANGCSPVIAMQAVPKVSSSIAVVRSYRETLSRLFDKPPTSLSLAGFIAARYTYEVLNRMAGAPTPVRRIEPIPKAFEP